MEPVNRPWAVLARPIEVGRSLGNGNGLPAAKAGHHPVDTDKALPFLTVDENVLFTAVQTLTKVITGMGKVSRIGNHKPPQGRIGIEYIEHAAGNHIKLLLGKSFSFFTNFCHDTSPPHGKAGD